MAGPTRNDLIECRSVLPSIRCALETRVAREFGPSHRLAQRAELIVASANDRDPSIFTARRINSVRRKFRIAVAIADLRASIRGIIEQRRSQEMQRRLGLRLVDILSLPGPPPIFERGQNCDRREAR